MSLVRKNSVPLTLVRASGGERRTVWGSTSETVVGVQRSSSCSSARRKQRQPLRGRAGRTDLPSTAAIQDFTVTSIPPREKAGRPSLPPSRPFLRKADREIRRRQLLAGWAD